MNDHLEPVPVGKLLKEFSDYTLAELVLEIKEGKEALEQEKKQHAATTFARTKAEQRVEDLQVCVNTALRALNGEEPEPEEETE